MASDAQLAKAYGRLPGVSLESVGHVQQLADESTRLLLKQRDCGAPDASDPSIAQLWSEDAEVRATSARVLAGFLDLPVDDCAGLIEAHRRMGAYNNQRWPSGCHDEHPEVHAVKLFVDWASCPAHNLRPVTDEELDGVISAGVWPFKDRASLREYWGDLFELKMARCARWLADEAWRVKGLLYVHVDDGPNGSEHQQHIRFKPIPGSTIGVGWFPNGSCADHVNQHIDTIPFGLHSLARLFAHEDGHNNGEPHQFNNQRSHMSVMSYTRPRSGLFYGFSTGSGPYPSWLPEDRSLPSIRDKYGGEPVPPFWEAPDSPPDPPDPVQGGGWEDVTRWRAEGYAWRIQKRSEGGEPDPVVQW